MSNGLDYFLDTVWTVGRVDIDNHQSPGKQDGIQPGDTLDFQVKDGRIICIPATKDEQTKRRWSEAGFIHDPHNKRLLGMILCANQPYIVQIIERQQGKSRHIECLYHVFDHAHPVDGPVANHNGMWHGDD